MSFFYASVDECVMCGMLESIDKARMTSGRDEIEYTASLAFCMCFNTGRRGDDLQLCGEHAELLKAVSESQARTAAERTR